jgi:hypothetical protein
LRDQGNTVLGITNGIGDTEQASNLQQVHSATGDIRQPFALSAPSKWLIRRIRMADYNISVRQSDYAAEFHQFQYFQRIFIDAVP